MCSSLRHSDGSVMSATVAVVLSTVYPSADGYQGAPALLSGLSLSSRRPASHWATPAGPASHWWRQGLVSPAESDVTITVEKIKLPW